MNVAQRFVQIQAEAVTGVLRVVGDGDAKLRGLTCEDGLNARETDFKADNIALALVHRDETEPDQQEGQNE